MSDLTWIAEARKYIGQREIKGSKHNPLILSWLNKLSAWWANDEVPWCGAFVAQALQAADRNIPAHWYRASDYLNTGTRLERPCYGCIVVFSRSGGGHVGFIIGKDKYGNLMVLGGNQSDQVSIVPFNTSRVSGYIWPSKQGQQMLPNDERYQLPLLNSDGRVSVDES
jgi:uncharacterized protein (TIGR02594 family)